MIVTYEASDFIRLLEKIEGRLAGIEAKLDDRAAVAEQTEALSRAAAVLKAAVESPSEGV